MCVDSIQLLTLWGPKPLPPVLGWPLKLKHPGYAPGIIFTLRQSQRQPHITLLISWGSGPGGLLFPKNLWSQPYRSKGIYHVLSSTQSFITKALKLIISRNSWKWKSFKILDRILSFFFTLNHTEYYSPVLFCLTTSEHVTVWALLIRQMFSLFSFSLPHIIMDTILYIRKHVNLRSHGKDQDWVFSLSVLEYLSNRGVQPFGVSGPHIKYIVTHNHKKIWF